MYIYKKLADDNFFGGSNLKWWMLFQTELMTSHWAETFTDRCKFNVYLDLKKKNTVVPSL